MRVAVFAVAAIVSAFVAVPPAHAQRGVQLDPNEELVLVNKRLGNQQWAITMNLNDQTVTGNVFNLDGSNPQFLFCDIFEPSIDFFPDDLLENPNVVIECFVAAGCEVLPCDDEERWVDVGERTIVSTFFLPETQSASAAIVPTPTDAPAAAPSSGGSQPMTWARG